MLVAALCAQPADALIVGGETHFVSKPLPSGLSNIHEYNTPILADLDGDGDLDVLRGGLDGIFYYFENTGTPSTPAFASSGFGFGIGDVGWNGSVALGDLDGDGDLDALCGNYDGHSWYWENTGTGSAPVFVNRGFRSDLPDIGSDSAHAFGDLDGDGDLDLIAGRSGFDLLYFENTGTAIAAAFGPSTSLPGFVLSGVYVRNAPTVGDLDSDGDLDILIGTSSGKFALLENTGTATAPAFASASTPDGLVDVGLLSAPAFGDLDGDGDLDVLAGEAAGDFYYFENSMLFAAGDAPAGLTAVTAYSSPVFGDLDGDLDLDVLTGITDGNFAYFENTGTPAAPDFTTGALTGLLDIGAYISPALGNLDGDSDLDVLAGEATGDFYYFENTGTPFAPDFTAGAFSGLSNISTFVTPTIGDLDGDGDLDILAGNASGSFGYFENTGTPLSLAFTTGALSGLASVGNFSTPELGDFDGDGDLDILSGDNTGGFFYFENTGTPLAPAFITTSALDGLSAIGGYSAPAAADLDGDGDLDILSGDSTVAFSYFENLWIPVPKIMEGGRVVVAMNKNSAPTSFALTLNAMEVLDYALEWSIRLDGTHGNAVASGSGSSQSISYMPNADFSGVDVFIVEVANVERGTIASTTVVVRVLDPADAATLSDNFAALDVDNSDGLSLAEAQAQLPGLIQLEFDTLDSNGDGVLALLEITRAIAGPDFMTPVYVNFANTGVEDGTTPTTGYNTVLEGATHVTEGGIVILSGGTTSETIYIPVPMKLQSGGGGVTIGNP